MGDISCHNFINIYSPQKPREKMRLWGEIQQILDAHQNEPFCIAGDFNCILDESESLNCAYRRIDFLVS